MEFLDEIINMRVKPSDKEKLIQKAKEKHLTRVSMITGR
jgi:hypothetical protein